MNANEVIANIALEKMGAELNAYQGASDAAYGILFMRYVAVSFLFAPVMANGRKAWQVKI